MTISNVNPFTTYIEDHRLTSHILSFTLSPSIPLINRHFRSVAYTASYPGMLKECRDFVRKNPDQCAFLSPRTMQLICHIPTDPTKKNCIKKIYHAIKANAQANGNTIVWNEFNLTVILKHIDQEDQDLVKLFEAINRRFHFVPEKARRAKEIRNWMRKNKHLFKEIKNLNLSQCGLKNIPKEITYFKSLIILNLSNNQITSVSAKISKLSKLAILDLSKNQLLSLPAEFASLNKLITLSMHDNQFKQFPDVLLRLPQLKTLNLAFNAIHSFLMTDQDLPAIRKLDISFNQLTQLPQALQYRQHLIDIDFRRVEAGLYKI